jgi:glycosyltransferase involved in cell wall biosynthesis
MKKKIGIFTGYFLPHAGGVERYTDKLSAALSKLGYDLVIVTFNESNTNNYEKNDGRTIYRLPVLDIAKERYPIPKINGEYRTLVDKIREENIDFFILNTRFHLTSLIGSWIGKQGGKPVILVEHGTDHFTVNSTFLDFFGRIYEHLLTTFIKKNVDKYYGVSKKCTIWLKHFSIQASGVFYNAVLPSDTKAANDEFIKKYPKEEVVITYIGRLIREKGVLNLIDAFNRLDNNKSIRLVIAGDGELLEPIREKYTTSNIDVLGRLNFIRVMSLFKRTDIFVYPSLYPEGLPTSILEAGLMECAIVATPRGGTEEVIIDEQHGTIIGDTVEDLQAALTTLIGNPAMRKAQAHKAQKRIETLFAWDAVAKEVSKEIEGLKK